MHLVRLTCCLALTLCITTFAATDFKVGPDTTVDSLAVCAGQTNYLVSWRDLRNGPSTPRITGTVVTTTGTQIPDFPISDVGGQPVAAPVQRATSAFDNANYLVVWADNRSGGAGIRGALVSPQGVVAGGHDFLIAPVTTLNNNNPQVIFAAADYCVAWQDTPAGSSGGTQIFYTRISFAGVVQPVVALPLNSGTTSYNQSLEFLVRGLDAEVLLVYQDLAASPAACMGVRIAADNTIAATAGVSQTLLFKREIADNGFGVPVAVGYDGTQYIVLSSFGAQIDSTIFQTRFRIDGTVLRPAGSFAEIAQGATGLVEDVFPRGIYNPSVSNVQITPSIVNNTATSEWLFLRNIKASDTAYHIFFERVLNDGTNRDLNPVIQDSAQQGILNGVVAAVIGTQYLIVWQDGRRLPSQPSAGGNIYGVLYDDTQLGDVTKPFLKAIARAGPISGVAPLIVQFVGDSSSGAVDSFGWDFGDGTSVATLSPQHTYTADGTYTAVLSLRRFGYQLHDFIRIAVGGTLLGGGGGPAQSTAGTLGANSSGVNPYLLVSNLVLAADYKTANSDQLRFFGYFDPSNLPISLKGTSGVLNIGSNTYAFSIDSTGKVVVPSTGAKIVFNINLTSGAFVVSTTADNLAPVLSAVGAKNETVTKPGKTITIPVSFTFANLSYQANVTGNYLATAGKSGRFNYQFAVKDQGATDAGFIHISGAAAKEGGASPNRTDSFGVTGTVGVGTTYGVIKAASGNWTIALGNYTESIPVNLLTTTSKGTIYTYKPPTGKKTGIVVFQYDTASGRFALQVKNIPAEGDAACGLPLTTATANRADMAFSVTFASATGSDYQSSIYVRLARKKSGSKSWVLR